MSLLLPAKKYARIPQQQPELVAVKKESPTLIEVLENEECDLQHELNQIEQAKSREHDLRLRLNVVQQSLQAFRALEAAPEPAQEQLAPPPPVVTEKRIRKAAKVRETPPKKLGEPIGRGIANGEYVKYAENIALVHDDFATFPE
jgi:Fic family protein